VRFTHAEVFICCDHMTAGIIVHGNMSRCVRLIREFVEKFDPTRTNFHPCASIQRPAGAIRFPLCSFEHTCSPEPSLNFWRVIHPRSVFSEAAHDGASNTAARLTTATYEV
jgi:hypothetical protein